MSKNIKDLENDKLMEDNFLSSISENPQILNQNHNKTPAQIEKERIRAELIEKNEEETRNVDKSGNEITDIHGNKETIEEFEEKMIQNQADPYMESFQNDPPVHNKQEIDEDDSVSDEEIEQIEEIEQRQAEIDEPVRMTVGYNDSIAKNPKKTEKKPKKKEKTVKIASPSQVEEIKKDKEEKAKKIDIESDDFDAKIRDSNIEIAKKNLKMQNYMDEEETAEDIVEKVNKIYNNEYIDNTSDEKVAISVIEEPEKSKIVEKQVEEAAKDKENVDIRPGYFGGDGQTCAFKLRTAKLSKILRNVKIDDTSSIKATDISTKTSNEQQNIYLSTVLPSLQPSYSVVPLILSGVVITMTAFMWFDATEILKLDEEIDELEQDGDYTYEKNKIFIKKRRRQAELFYNHVYSVSGYETKPDIETFYRKIVKFPDFRQLFFAALTATYQKKYKFDITCSTCGTTQELMVSTKDLCFLLGKSIKIDQLNRFIEKGGSIGSKESLEIYQEFQKEKIVEMAHHTFRTTKNLPISSFIYELEVPYVYDAFDMMDELAETFRDKDFEYIDPNTGNSVYIDSAFGLPDYLIKLRSYLYVSSLMVAQVVDEDSSDNSATISYLKFTEKNSIMNSLYNLTSDDYKTFMNDKNLKNLLSVQGIRHAINAKLCTAEACKSDMGIIPTDPEMLFFTIAKQENPD